MRHVGFFGIMHYPVIGFFTAFLTVGIGFIFYKTRWSRFGSIAVLASFFVMLWYAAFETPYLLGASIKIKHLAGLTFAGIIVYAGAYLDHRLRRSGRLFFASVFAAAGIIVASGIGVRVITNPFGGVISLARWEYVLFWWQGIGYRITLPADGVTFIWLFIVIYTMRRLNTLDGLTSGITGIGALMVFFLAIATKYFQPEVAALATVASGVFIGMLVWNWHPARLRLGAGGAAFAGITLGTLAIISGGKIATTLLVLGVPVLDVVWGWVRRAVWGQQGITERKQLPYRLLDAGFSHRGAVIFLLCISAAFGATALILQSAQKLIVLAVLGAIAAFLLIVGSVAEPVPDTRRGQIRRRSILGIAVDSMVREDAVHHAEVLLQKGGQHIITTPNPEMLVDAQKDPEFKNALNRASLALPDGFGLMLAARILKQPIASRVPGVDFVWDLARLAAEKNYRVCLVGGQVGVAQSAGEAIISRLRNCAIVKSMSEPNVDIIREAKPDILLIALGHGKQEKWIAAHLSEMPSVKIAMGVGGTFDFLAGRVSRAPRLLRLLGLEWLWRLLRQPQRLPRIWRALIKFPLLVLKVKLFH